MIHARSKFLVFSLIFIFLLLTGLSLALQKPLWSDELFTQIFIVHQSYNDILLLDYPGSGNSNAPLFYILQKVFCDIIHFDIPAQLMSLPLLPNYDPANIFLRILPIVWMSLAFMVILIYFSYRFHFLLGILGLFLALCSPILWTYWAEARPYGLWILLTCLQMSVFIDLLEQPTVSSKKLLGLVIIHLSLSFTCTLSILQITVASLLLLSKRLHWWQYLAVLAIPLGVAYYYKPHLPFNDLIFIPSAKEILDSVISRDIQSILLFYPLMLILYWLQQRKMGPVAFRNNRLWQSLGFFVAIFLVIFLTYGFLVFLRLHAAGINQIMMPRHVIFLAPVGIFAVTYLIGILWQSLEKGPWLKLPVFGAITVLLVSQIFQFPWYKIFSH